MRIKYILKLVASVVGTFAVVGIAVGVALLLDASIFNKVLSRMITVQISVVVLLAFALVNFLFIINFLYNYYTKNKVVLANIEKEKEIDRTKHEFIGLISHQLRTPLSAINWYTEALTTDEAEGLNTKQKEYISRIDDSNQRMVALVNSFIDVSSIELHTFVSSVKPIDVSKLADTIIDGFHHQIQNKSIVVRKQYDAKLGIVAVDERYIRMILDHLLSNAIKYSPSGAQVTVTITKDRAKLSIVVADTGYGIPADQNKKVFTKLFRARNILEKDTDGMGLGLYVVKSIIDYAKGKIWFESTENVGTTFFVTLPIQDTTTT